MKLVRVVESYQEYGVGLRQKYYYIRSKNTRGKEG